VIGSTVSHYKILEKIGEGGMGVVYRATDLRLGRTVALKFLPEHLTRDREAKERFLNEARAVSALEHPNICTIHEVDETPEGQIFICMACYDGGTLRDRLREGSLPLAEAIDIATKVGRGLETAHGAHIIHRDIKPGNIMLTEPEGVRIVDFGVAKLAGYGGLTSGGQTLGTVAYMSPEQATGSDVDERTDIWSLGVVLYEMVTGTQPFGGEYDQATIYSILHVDPESVRALRPEAPPELQRIIEKALERDRTQRYATISEMIEDLRLMTKSLELAQVPSSLSWRFRTGREKVLRWALPAAVAALAAIAGWAYLGRRDTPPFAQSTPIQVTSAAGWEGQPALSPDGSRIAYTSDESGNYDIYATDLRGGRVLQLTDDPGADYDATWFPDGTALAFVSDRRSPMDVWKVGQFGGSPTLLIGNAACPAISPDGRRVAFSRINAKGDYRVWVALVDDPSSAVQLTIDDDPTWGHVEPAWSPDGREICYATLHNLCVIPADGGAPRQLTSIGEGDGDPAWSPDGAYVYFTSKRGGTEGLWCVRSRGGKPERVTTGAGHEHDPSLAGNGKRLAYASASIDYHMAVVDRTTGTEADLPRLKGPSMAAISADGRRIIFSGSLWGTHAQIGEILLDHGRPVTKPRPLTDQDGDASSPSISRDGKWIAYHLIVGDQRDLWVVQSGGGLPVRLTEGGASNIHPAWSPDGRELAFVSDRAGQFDVWVSAFEDGALTGEPRRLTDGTIPAYVPSWSPDGTTVAFFGIIGEHCEVCTVPSDGSAAWRQLTRGADAMQVRWDPTTGAILASASCGLGRRCLWSVSPEDGSLSAVDPVVDFGPASALGLFDVSADGRYLVLSRESLEGDIWMLEMTKGTF
jgi:Tol biopolymer transport system component